MVYFLRTDLIAGAITFIALIINGVGTFCNAWWEDRTGRRHGLFSDVSCDKGMCQFAKETDAWITVAQVSAFVQFFGLIVALIVHLMNICEAANRRMLRFLTIVLLALSCTFALVHTFLLTSVYAHLGRTYDSQGPLPLKYAYFLTLPVGMNAISGTLSIGPLIALLVVHTRETGSEAQRDAGTKARTKEEKTAKELDTRL